MIKIILPAKGAHIRRITKIFSAGHQALSVNTRKPFTISFLKINKNSQTLQFVVCEFSF